VAFHERVLNLERDLSYVVRHQHPGFAILFWLYLISRDMDWIEIVEPKTKHRMFANLKTGECSWDPPLNEPMLVD